MIAPRCDSSGHNVLIPAHYTEVSGCREFFQPIGNIESSRRSVTEESRCVTGNHVRRAHRLPDHLAHRSGTSTCARHSSSSSSQLSRLHTREKFVHADVSMRSADSEVAHVQAPETTVRATNIIKAKTAADAIRYCTRSAARARVFHLSSAIRLFAFFRPQMEA